MSSAVEREKAVIKMIKLLFVLINKVCVRKSTTIVSLQFLCNYCIAFSGLRVCYFVVCLNQSEYQFSNAAKWIFT